MNYIYYNNLPNYSARQRAFLDAALKANADEFWKNNKNKPNQQQGEDKMEEQNNINVNVNADATTDVTDKFKWFEEGDYPPVNSEIETKLQPNKKFIVIGYNSNKSQIILENAESIGISVLQFKHGLYYPVGYEAYYDNLDKKAVFDLLKNIYSDSIAENFIGVVEDIFPKFKFKHFLDIK